MNLDDSRFLYFLREEAAPALETYSEEVKIPPKEIHIFQKIHYQDNDNIENKTLPTSEPNDSIKPEQSQQPSLAQKLNLASKSKKKKKKKNKSS